MAVNLSQTKYLEYLSVIFWNYKTDVYIWAFLF